MRKVNISISIDPVLKRKSIKLFKKLGLDLSTAINLFLKQSILCNDLPFDLTFDDKDYEPNEVTLAAFAEEDEMRNDPKKYKRYESFDEFRKDVEKVLKK